MIQPDPVGFIRHQFEEALQPFADAGADVTVFAARPDHPCDVFVSAIVDEWIVLQCRLTLNGWLPLMEQICDALWAHRIAMIGLLNGLAENGQSLARSMDAVLLASESPRLPELV